MIDQVLTLVASRLNGHLAGQFRTSEEVVSLSPLTDVEGKPADNIRNKLALFITNIAQDQMPRGVRSGRGSALGQVNGVTPVHLDIYVMLAAAHDPDKYVEGLKQLSMALRFFQAQPVMTSQNTPELPAGLEQLSFEISNLKVEEMGQMWGNLGGRYVPSVMFKMRFVTIDAGAVTGIAPVIRSPQRSAEPADGGR